jgi:ASCH domain
MPRRGRIEGWKPTFFHLRALSIRQPWAWLVVSGYKDIENRSWRTNHREPLRIHASPNRSEFEARRSEIQKRHRVKIPPEEELNFGGIVGLVEVVDCVRTHHSKWN